jgi:hypothetical protein
MAYLRISSRNTATPDCAAARYAVACKYPARARVNASTERAVSARLVHTAADNSSPPSIESAVEGSGDSDGTVSTPEIPYKRI